ncbi:MAG: NAD(P)H-dependent oxidoreductase [Woeseiaceae bacterium]|nr:NAD(P)H-dependent oxidoreductase [Woeseiaceae bacterium]
MTLKTAVIYGSVRSARQGIKAARFIVRKLHARGHEVTLVDAAEYELPLLDRMYKEYDPGKAPAALQAIADILDAADGFVILSGEYNHSIPPALKNLLDHFQKEYLYKPSAIVTYSAGPFGGLRGLINMRAILAELGSPSIPSVFPVSKVGRSFDEDGNAVDTAYEGRVGKFLDEYEWYARALKAERERGACGEDSPGQQLLCRG